MNFILLIVIYICFIGLGIPDSLFGTAFPSIADRFSLSLTAANYVTVITYICTLISSLSAPKLIKKFKTGIITAVSTLLTAVGLIVFATANNYIYMILAAIPMGLGAGAIDAALNNYVSNHYKAIHINFLHCFYGVGITLSPLILSETLKNNSYQNGYLYMFFIQLGIAFLALLSLPIWKKLDCEKYDEIKQQNEEMTIISAFKNKTVILILMVFLFSCAIEYILNVYGSSFLVEDKNLDVASAAVIITFYYVGIALGRFLSGILSIKIKSINITRFSVVLLSIGILMLFIPYQNKILFSFAVLLIGLGNSPVYPNFIHIISVKFSENNSPTIISLSMAFAVMGTTLGPLIFSLFAKIFSLNIFPLALIILTLTLLVLINIFAIDKNNKNKI